MNVTVVFLKHIRFFETAYVEKSVQVRKSQQQKKTRKETGGDRRFCFLINSYQKYDLYGG